MNSVIGQGVFADEEQVVNVLGIHPVEYKVLIKQDKVEDTVGRIIVPDSTRERMQIAQERGILVEAGGRAFEDFKKPTPKIGDHVMYCKHSGVLIKDDKNRNQEWRVINDKDITAILREE